MKNPVILLSIYLYLPIYTKAPSVSRLRDDSVVRGHTANLTCTFDGSPAPTVTWLKDGKVINQRTSPTTNIRIYTRRIRIKPRTSKLISKLE
ncbi:hypothetical protein Anas_07123 [Armadillidium nasatum]|uniref:Ig-like domain-containing protein n=1 Tax=Armadillidium nasatum TaxID=96803 RepID=A0A5N5TKA0_9CRUS|nr:hypothetical protein Anas_07123 [Armadillidium nasatum]